MTSIGLFALAIALGQAGGQVPATPAPQQPAPPQQGTGPQAAAPQAPASAARPGAPARAEGPNIDEERLYKNAGPVMPLDEAVGTAVARNLDLKVAQARLDQARTLPWQAWSGYLPHVSATGAYTYNPHPFSIPLGLPDGSTITVDLLTQNQLNGQVAANQAVFAPALFFVIPNAYRQETAASLGVEGVRRVIAFAAAQAYYGVASGRRLVEASERLLEISLRQEKDAQIRLRAGTIAKVGLVRAEIDRARAEQDVRRARNSYLSAKIALAALLDRNDLAFEVADPPPVDVAGSVDELVARALRDRTDVQGAAIDVDISRGQRNAVVSRYLPNLGAFLQYNASNTGGLTGQQTSWAAGAALSWDILDGGLREAQIRAANARIDESISALAASRNRAATEVRQSLLDYQSARANAVKAKEQLDLAAENQRLVDVSYRAGAATALEQADAVTALRNAEIAFQAESLGAEIAGLRVLLAAGASDPRTPVAGTTTAPANGATDGAPAR
jgi:outer membrane protein TolC